MSLYKHEQTDGSENWLFHIWAWFFSLPCKSHIEGWEGGSLQCRLLRWHKGKHDDTYRGVRWCYGDEFFGE